MDQATLLQLAGSALAICVLALAAAWARIPRQVGPLDEATARALIAEELPDIAVERLWLDAEGRTAVAKAGGEGVVLFRVGDGFAVRSAAWPQVAGAVVRKGRALIRFGDPAAPVAAFQLGGLQKAPFA
jgi:thiamine biosynthesis lipoprotein ApbE